MRQTPSVAAGWLLGLAALLAAVVAASATVGFADLGPATVVAIVLERVGLVGDAGATAIQRTILWEIRLDRIALAAAVGTALAVAGTVMQGVFRNPLADPSIIGVSTGAAAGAVAFIVLGPATVGVGLPAAALSGGLATAAVVYLIATRGGRTPVATLLLAGVAVQALLGAAISYLMVVSEPHGLRAAVMWLIGSLDGADWSEAAVVATAAAVGTVVLALYARDLNVLLLDRESAHALGVEVGRTRRVLLGVASLLTGVAVMYVGVVGFVGLVVPHVMRLLVGPDHRLLLPTSALAGGSFLVVADTVARAGAQSLPVGVVTAFVGAPFFLYLLRRREVYAL